ncbi:MAG TPA: D-aminoacyl-tRNA deacylase [Caldisericia bacterium]|nr:D-aminoacyl-tRNA deacylase [Caldisericia bacterium]HPF49630.1 D-aminoacyl-tRNA deacylase [Caldisericia bacterium]HPI82951.1 D-aminoacyl-tRNA deacylase [Caldisericia bacterium]HPQ92178.1 D-aminoacyl-tRNA deacylase [Caldisericia bacterium]HRV74724.1 D-aminoacyl-tRNA deacylase [Caldisericia bacterium]
MRAVIQRVDTASVSIDNVEKTRIEKGLLALIAVMEGDTIEDADYIATKILGLRVFPDSEDKMNLSVYDIAGSVLVVSQFTLAGDARKGKRPSFSDSASPEDALPLLEEIEKRITKASVGFARGEFGSHMKVSLVNDGPVTILLDSRKNF